ncbi:LysR family transcriptional regulator [Microbacterium sp. LWH12-1.2]|uniref:LysR family transcriptional regulator n=1 Tax=Microbacterium sp. LWH12-1.2 TaxID=3135259 RepID=UPI0034230A71
MNLDWREVEVFLEVAQELHFGRAAENLRLSQARVSQTIKSLEMRIGAPLFERTTRRVSLTSIGNGLLKELHPAREAVINSFAHAIDQARSASGTVTVSFFSTLAARVAVDIFTELATRHPGMTGELRETPLTDPCQPLRDHEVEVAITQFPVNEPSITSGPVILREPLVLGVGIDHPLASRESVTLEELGDVQIFRPGGSPSRHWLENYLPWNTPGGRPIARGPSVTTFQQMLALIANGEGVSPMGAHNARYYPRPDIAYVPISDASPLEFGLAWLTSNENARIRAFVETAVLVVEGWGGPSAAARR